LAAQQQQLDERRRDLGQRKQERSALLSRLKSDMSDRAAQRTRLAADQTRLESLVEELARRAQRLDGDTFVNSRGALPWPVRGQVTHRFGKERAGGRLKWQGVFIEAADGSEVRAIHSGRVAFADWLRGFGLLTIIDHGSGYMTLYAHTDVLYKNVGDWVEGGEPIATAGTSGGQPDSGLYFEIRASGTPRDPLGWLSRR
jgi:septal ring factor EnvC (AmiA/AmiB activator)